MAVSDIVPVPGARFEETLASASPDFLREMIKGFAQRMMDAEVEEVCGAAYGEVSPDRVNSRNGYRRRDWDTRAGTIEVAIPKLRQGTYYPEWLLERRRRAERALAAVVATSYLLGVSTRRVEKLAECLGVTKLSKSQVSVMAAELDEIVSSFRSRPLDAGPYTFVQLGALNWKVREGGRTVNVHALIATGVNADGKREILGLEAIGARRGWRRSCSRPRPSRYTRLSAAARSSTAADQAADGGELRQELAAARRAVPDPAAAARADHRAAATAH
jgi:transposase-like protein